MNMKIVLLVFTCFLSCSSFQTKKNSSQKLMKASLLSGHTREQHEAFADNLMITTQGVHSTQAGLKMIELGGNAFDAAAAISFTISVERPQSTGLGGGGFMLIDGPEFEKPVAVDFREKAPQRAHSKMFLEKDGSISKNKSIDGVMASGVPGVVKGVLAVHKKYGKLSRQVVMQPAIDLALNGFLVYPHLAKALKHRQDILSKYPASVKIFFKNGIPLEEGDLLVQKDLAKTLEAIQKHGEKGFYDGWVASAIAKEFQRQKGLITLDDLKNYDLKWREPISGKFKNYDIFSMPPPSSGGTHVIQILNILEPLKLKSLGAQSVEAIHSTATAMQLAFVDRARYMGDRDFVKVPVQGLTSKAYAKTLRLKMKDQALKLQPEDLEDAFAYESDETTHFTVMDKLGNVVSSTQTINYWMGSGVVIPETGIVMNDEMDDFSKKAGDTNLFGAVGSKNNLVQAGKRPLSSMSPTIIKKNGEVVLALGTPAGTRILTCVAQVALNYLEYEFSLWDSVAATRIHHQWKPNQLRVGEPGFPKEVEAALMAKGHELNKKNLGCSIQAIAVESGKLHGVSDPRGEGMALGNE